MALIRPSTLSLWGREGDVRQQEKKQAGGLCGLDRGRGRVNARIEDLGPRCCENIRFGEAGRVSP